MGREGYDYWGEQLSEYWDSGLKIQEYSELKELPYENTCRWIRVLQKVSVHQGGTRSPLYRSSRNRKITSDSGNWI